MARLRGFQDLQTKIASLLFIAQGTSKCQVLFFRRPFMLFRYDVIHFMRCKSHKLRDQAILTTLFGSLPHAATQLSGNVRLAQRPPMLPLASRQPWLLPYGQDARDTRTPAIRIARRPISLPIDSFQANR